MGAGPVTAVGLFPVALGGVCLSVSVSAHVDLAEVAGIGVVRGPVDGICVVRERVDDGVGGDALGQGSGPVVGADWLAIRVGWVRWADYQG